MVVQSAVGDRFPNFTFRDERGITQDLRQNLGEFAVLIFSQCGENLHGPASRALMNLVHANQEPGYVETVGFDVHWSVNDCPRHGECHLLEGGPRIFSICDARAQVRNLYRVTSEDEIIAIGPDQQIVIRAPLSEYETVAHALAYMFGEHAETVAQTKSPEE